MQPHGGLSVARMYDFEPEEAPCWILKGQGNANAVFAYASGEVRVPSRHPECFTHSDYDPDDID